MMASNALHLATGAVVTWLGRALYLATVIAVAVAAWLVLGVIASPFVRPHLRSNAGVVMVTSAIRGDTLPLRYAKRIESIPGTRHVLFSDYSVVSCNDTAPAVSINARGGSGAQAEILGEAAGKSASDNALRKKWQSDPLGVLVGTRVASTCGWKAGMIVSPRDYFSGSPITTVS